MIDVPPHGLLEAVEDRRRRVAFLDRAANDPVIVGMWLT